MQKVGLTGNISSGKTQVENILLKKGYLVIDLDKVSADLFSNDLTVKKEIFELFKTNDKKIISEIVFSSPEKRKALEEIIHPRLKKILQDLFQSSKEDVVFVSGALLYEANFAPMFDKIIFVNAPFEVRLERLKKRNNLNDEQALKRMNSQNDNFKNKADYILENSSTLKVLEEKTDKILNEILN